MSRKMAVWLLPVLLVPAWFGATLAGELSADSIHGKWLFTRILMDGEREMPVNRPIQFLPDGTAVTFDSRGQEISRANYTVREDAIIYTDARGEQVWKLVSLAEGKLHVDHRGAEMFFERQ